MKVLLRLFGRLVRFLGPSTPYFRPLVIRLIGGAKLQGPFELTLDQSLIISDEYTVGGRAAVMEIKRIHDHEIVVTLRTNRYAQPNLRDAGELYRERHHE